MEDVKSRLLSKCELDPKTGCWMWTAGKTTNGYGSFMVNLNGKQKFYRAHRASYELHKGDIPQGMFVCHKCDTPLCINPDHLFLGTPLDNVRDMDAKGRGVRSGGPLAKRALTAEQVAHIKRREMTGIEYAKLYGVHRAHISNIQRGTRYADF